MIQERVNKLDIVCDAAEFAARCGMPIGEYPDCFSKVYEEVYAVISPSYAYSVLDVEECGNGVKIGGIYTESAAITKLLRGCQRVILLLCTLGASVQRQIQRQTQISVERGFVADCIADSFCESLASLAQKRSVKMEKIVNHTGRFSPGYADLPLEFGRELVNACGLGKALGVSFTDTSLMLPTKTISAIIGLKDN